MVTPRDVRIRVQEADALRYEADALVLKYAQASYGVDAKAVELTGSDPRDLPARGRHRVVRDPTGLRARALIFLGVVPLVAFRYREIRDFAHRALRTVAGELPDAREIAVTTHGAGYGLDETESFDSELAGILDAVREGDVPRTLERVTILEIDHGRASRYAERLESTLLRPAAVTRGASVEEVVDPNAARHVRTVGFESAKRRYAFVAMSSNPAFEDRFIYGISSAVRDSGLLCERIDDQVLKGRDLRTRLKDRISTATIVIAELTGANPNVYLELGLAWGHDVPTVLLCEQGADLKFDVQEQKCLFYKSIKNLEDLLSDELRGRLGPATASA